MNPIDNQQTESKNTAESQHAQSKNNKRFEQSRLSSTASSNAQRQVNLLGILSIILLFIPFMTVLGLIVGVVGKKVAKKKNLSSILPKIGIILNAMLIAFAILLYISLWSWSRQDTSTGIDANRKNIGQGTITAASYVLENFYDNNRYYPENLYSLRDNGYNSWANEVSEVISNDNYEYKPSECEAAQCSGYELTFKSSSGEIYREASRN